MQHWTFYRDLAVKAEQRRGKDDALMAGFYWGRAWKAASQAGESDDVVMGLAREANRHAVAPAPRAGDAAGDGGDKRRRPE